jgi:hypothetical protein
MSRVGLAGSVVVTALGIKTLALNIRQPHSLKCCIVYFFSDFSSLSFLASNSIYRCSFCSHLNFLEKMAMKTTISISASNRTPGLKSVVSRIMVALLYQPEKKFSVIGITKSSARGIPSRNCRKVRFCFSRFAAQ